MSNRTGTIRYSLVLEPLAIDGDAAGIVRLRIALKALLRTHGLRCLRVAPAERGELADRFTLERTGRMHTVMGPDALPWARAPSAADMRERADELNRAFQLGREQAKAEDSRTNDDEHSTTTSICDQTHTARSPTTGAVGR